MIPTSLIFFFFFFNDTATTEIYTLSLHGRSSDLDLGMANAAGSYLSVFAGLLANSFGRRWIPSGVNFHAAWKLTPLGIQRSEEHTSELQSLTNLVCRLLLEKKKKKKETSHYQR